MKNTKSVFLTIFIFILTIKNFAQEWSMPPAPVEVALAENTNLAANINIPANIISQHYGWLSAETTGRIKSIKAIGTIVKTGDIVAEINTVTLRAQRKEQENSVKSAGSQISYLRNQVSRLNELRAKNIAAESQIEETQAQLDLAISSQAASQARLSQVDIGLAASKIRARFDGTITEQAIKIGEWASPGRDVIRVVNLNKKEVLARTALSNIRYLKVGDVLDLSDNKSTGSAKINALVPFGEITDGVYEIRMSLENGDWRVGENITAQISQSGGNSMLSVPRDAIILRTSGSSIIKVLEDNTTQRIQVSTGLGTRDRITVTTINGKLNVGDKVIIRGGERLQDGQEIAVKN